MFEDDDNSRRKSPGRERCHPHPPFFFWNVAIRLRSHRQAQKWSRLIGFVTSLEESLSRLSIRGPGLAGDRWMVGSSSQRWLQCCPGPSKVTRGGGVAYRACWALSYYFCQVSCKLGCSVLWVILAPLFGDCEGIRAEVWGSLWWLEVETLRGVC